MASEIYYKRPPTEKSKSDAVIRYHLASLPKAVRQFFEGIQPNDDFTIVDERGRRVRVSDVGILAELAEAEMDNEQTAVSDQWTAEMDTRRCELIDKKLDGEPTQSEVAELQRLQSQVEAYLDRVAPYPVDAVRRLHAKVLDGIERDWMCE